MLTLLKKLYQRITKSIQNSVSPDDALYHSESNMARPSRRNRTKRFNVVDVIRDIEMADSPEHRK